MGHAPIDPASRTARRRSTRAPRPTCSMVREPGRARRPADAERLLMDNPQPNAFATGRNPQNAAVAATTGLLQRLSREEVAGVIAHELAHIKNHDTLTMTITATIAGAISMLAQFGMFFGGNRDSNSGGMGMIGSLAMMILAPIAAMIVQMAISRTREYSADNMGAPHPRPADGAGLRARENLQCGAHAIPNEEAERNPATAHMFIINPLSGQRMDNLFSTHPATENRIAALQELARNWARAAAIRRRPRPRPALAAACRPPARGRAAVRAAAGPGVKTATRSS